MDSKALKNILNHALTFLVIFLIVNFVYNHFFNQAEPPKTGLHFYVDHKQYGQNDLITARLENYSQETITLKNLCPAPSLQAEKLENGQWVALNATAALPCEGQEDFVLEPGTVLPFDFRSWNHQLFHELGFYRLKANLGDQVLESNQFEVVNMSFFSWLWTTLIHQPIYNALIFFASILPGHDLGWAIILLTILLRTILLAPNQRALKSQKKLQSIQPKINALKDKFGQDQQRIAQETMALYKENKVNPFGSCLPILIQLPILIGLYNVIQSGMDPGGTYLLYGPLRDFDLTLVNTNFFGILELTKIDFFVLPIIVGILQFIQLKISMAKNLPKKDSGKDKRPSEMEMASRTMVYIMPFMIAFFTASVPSGVGLYWAFSTIYGIAQQIVVNRSHDRQETTIKVIDPQPDPKPEIKS